MGMIANYQFLSDDDLKLIIDANKNDDDFFEMVEELNEEADILLDIDKMWDVLHFVFTGADSSTLLKNNPLRQAIVGIDSFEQIEGVAYIKKSRVREIVKVLDSFDFKVAMENFSMEECKKADLYPNIWEYENELEEIKAELSDHFKNMKAFYKKVLENNGNVLITIY